MKTASRDMDAHLPALRRVLRVRVEKALDAATDAPVGVPKARESHVAQGIPLLTALQPGLDGLMLVAVAALRDKDGIAVHGMGDGAQQHLKSRDMRTQLATPHTTYIAMYHL